ncbi:MAG: DUF1080 domain-containing protein [Bacteroidetes bacterium]|nr:DUF1080 domain-containing protein [Bacteroidota bacterium]
MISTKHFYQNRKLPTFLILIVFISSLIIPASCRNNRKKKTTSPVGQWNRVQIISGGTHIEHWLNGKKVLEYERGSEQFRKLVEESKYKNIPGFGEASEGHILLQDHDNRVSFRNIKIRVLKP